MCAFAQISLCSSRLRKTLQSPGIDTWEEVSIVFAEVLLSIPRARGFRTRGGEPPHDSSSKADVSYPTFTAIHFSVSESNLHKMVEACHWHEINSVIPPTIGFGCRR